MDVQREIIAQSPKERVLLAAAILEEMPADGDIHTAFMAMRTALWELIEVAERPDAYMVGWNTIAKYAWAELLEYEETGNTDALERLKDKVAQAMEML